jgi:hypothetical protein
MEKIYGGLFVNKFLNTPMNRGTLSVVSIELHLHIYIERDREISSPTSSVFICMMSVIVTCTVFALSYLSVHIVECTFSSCVQQIIRGFLLRSSEGNKCRLCFGSVNFTKGFSALKTGVLVFCTVTVLASTNQTQYHVKPILTNLY